MTSVIDQQHTKITLGLAITVVAAIAGIAYEAGELDNRIQNLETSKSAMWAKLSKTEQMAQDIAVIKAAVERLEK